MKQRLSLPPSTIQVAASTVFLNLSNMATDGTPALDLPLVVEAASPQEVSAVPLEPSTRVFVIDPVLVLPDRKRLGCVDAKVVEAGVVPLGAKLRVHEPFPGVLRGAIRHVLTAKDAKFKHLLGRQIGPELGVEVLPHRLG